MARDTASPRPFTGDYARLIPGGVLLLYAAVVGLALLSKGSAMWGNSTTGTTLLVGSLLSAVACFIAWRELPREVNLPWLVFGGAALLASVHGGSMLGNFARYSNVVGLSLTGGSVLFMAGLVFIIQQSERGRWSELTLDVALMAVAALVVMLRWAPGIQGHSGDLADVLLLTIAPVAAFCSALLMVVLLAAPPENLPAPTAYALAGATICLGFSALPQVLDGVVCCGADSRATLAVLGVWVFLLFAAGTAMRAGGDGVLVPQGERLRQYVAPTVAIILGAIAVDIAVNPSFARRTGVAMGVLAALVALRLTQLLQATRSQAAERRELAQTRALIEVSRALAGANDLDVTLRTVTDSAQRVLNARAAAIELLVPEKQELVLRAQTGLSQDIVGQTYGVDSSFTGWVVKNGEIRVAANAAQDPLISAESAAVLGRSPMASLPLRYRERILGVISCIGTRPFDAEDLELLRAFANQAATAIEDAQLFDQVRALSMTDALTGLANRRGLDRELRREFAAARRGRKLIAVMFDLNDFKQHNDRYGHLAGDRALRHFAEALSNSTRAMNLAARFGGDEFFTLLADCDQDGAEIFVQRVRDKFQAAMQSAGNPLVSISAGIAEFRPDMKSAEELIEAADRALYISKSEGATSK